MAYVQLGSPFLKVRKTTKGKGRNFRTTEEGAGMTDAGVKKYKKENPGSKLQTAVTGDVKPGSKDDKRRKLTHGRESFLLFLSVLRFRCIDRNVLFPLF